MTRREEMLKSYLKNQGLAYNILQSSGMTFLTENDIWTILQAELDLIYSEVLHKNLSVEEIVAIVYQHINPNGTAIGSFKIDLEVEDIDWIPFITDDLEKATVRNDGKVWIIHQNDADPHPSIPHAHNYQDNYKLNLYTGDLYEKKRHVGKLKAKELAEIVSKIKKEFPHINFVKPKKN